MSGNEPEINYGALSFRAIIRDTYASVFNRGATLDRMAMADYDTGSNLKGRIEIVEQVALGAKVKPNNFHINQEEQHYMDWLKKALDGQSGNILLRDFFLYGETLLKVA